MDQPVFLHVGCGHLHQDRTPFANNKWREIRLDIDQSVQPDVVGTMTDMSAVPSGSVDAVFSSHNIEHLYPHEVPIALAEFNRVLKSDGFVLITCPDLQSVCALVANDLLTEPAYHSSMGPIAPLDILYGLRRSLNSGNLYMAHRSGFTKKVMASTLLQSGFLAGVRSIPDVFQLWAIGLKAESSADKSNIKNKIQDLMDKYFPLDR